MSPLCRGTDFKEKGTIGEETTWRQRLGLLERLRVEWQDSYVEKYLRRQGSLPKFRTSTTRRRAPILTERSGGRRQRLVWRAAAPLLLEARPPLLL